MCVVTAVHALDFRCVITKTPNKWQPVGEKQMSCSDRDSCFWRDLYVFLRPSLLVLGTLSALCRSTAFSWVRDVKWNDFVPSSAQNKTMFSFRIFEAISYRTCVTLESADAIQLIPVSRWIIRPSSAAPMALGIRRKWELMLKVHNLPFSARCHPSLHLERKS